MGKIAFVFSGQGAQTPGMGEDLCNKFQSARAVFEQAETLMPGLRELCFTGSKQQLSLTKNTQPCVYTVNMASAAALSQMGIFPSGVAGFSLGELCATVFAGAASINEGFSLCLQRAEITSKYAAAQGGTMVAVLRLTAAEVEDICLRHECVYPANYNSPQQTVVAAAQDSAEAFISDVKKSGGIAVKLAVQGAFHCPAMNDAAAEYFSVLLKAKLSLPYIPVYSNVTTKPYAGDTADTLAKQLASPVLWQQSIENMIKDGYDTFIETGTGNTLVGLINKIDPSVRAFKAENAEDIELIKKSV